MATACDHPGVFFDLSAAPGGPLADAFKRFFARDRSGPIVFTGMLSVELISSYVRPSR
jgi:hypothetical protein